MPTDEDRVRLEKITWSGAAEQRMVVLSPNRPWSGRQRLTTYRGSTPNRRASKTSRAFVVGFNSDTIGRNYVRPRTAYASQKPTNHTTKLVTTEIDSLPAAGTYPEQLPRVCR